METKLGSSHFVSFGLGHLILKLRESIHFPFDSCLPPCRNLFFSFFRSVERPTVVLLGPHQGMLTMTCKIKAVFTITFKAHLWTIGTGHVDDWWLFGLFLPNAFLWVKNKWNPNLGRRQQCVPNLFSSKNYLLSWLAYLEHTKEFKHTFFLAKKALSMGQFFFFCVAFLVGIAILGTRGLPDWSQKIDSLLVWIKDLSWNSEIVARDQPLNGTSNTLRARAPTRHEVWIR